MTNVDGIAYFDTNDGVHGDELWRSDGTADGTFLVADLWQGMQGSYPTQLTNVDGTLFFAANDREHGEELFKVSSMDDQGENRAANAARTASASLAAGPGSTVINALLPAAPAPTLSVTGPPPVQSKPAGPPTVGSARTASYAPDPGPSTHAAIRPGPDAGDLLDPGAVEALFAWIK